jgi:hypothetical protein
VLFVCVSEKEKLRSVVETPASHKLQFARLKLRLARLKLRLARPKLAIVAAV